MKNLRIISLLFLILFASACFAQEYYADIEITVLDNGEARVSGISNHPALAEGITSELISKRGSVWEISLSIDDEFSNYVYSVVFPEGAIVKGFEANGSAWVEPYNGTIRLVGTGENLPLKFSAEYELGEKSAVPSWLIAALALSAVIATGVSVFPRIEKIIAGKKTRKYNPALLTKRQQEIMKLIEAKGGFAMQSELLSETGLPKASLSRNIDSLAQKGIVKKERRGMGMAVYIPE